MDLLNPANPLNMVNPASPWYHVWNTESAPSVVLTDTVTTADKIAFGVIGVALCAVVVAFAYMLWDIARS